jgi:hypothetical protein
LRFGSENLQGKDAKKKAEFETLRLAKTEAQRCLPAAGGLRPYEDNRKHFRGLMRFTGWV